MDLKNSFKEMNIKLIPKTDKYLRPYKTKEDRERATYYNIITLLQVHQKIRDNYFKKIKNLNKHISRLMKLHNIYDKKYTQSFGNPEYKKIDIGEEVEKLDKIN